MEKINLALTVLLSGLIVVFFALIVLTFIIKGYGKIINKIQKNIDALKISKKQHEKLVVTTPEHCDNKIDGQIPAEVVVAISAAIYSCYGYTHKIYSVKRIKRSSSSKPIWSLAGAFENTRPF